MAKKVVIIGAGIAGLSAGCYARMNGYDVEIHEAHSAPGGLCTSWRRGDFVIDGCIHWLIGSAPGSGYYRIWEELGAIQGRRFVDHEVFSRVVGRDGRVLHFYTDVDRLEGHLKDLAPKDAGAASDLCGMIRRLAGFSPPIGKPAELMGPLDGMRMMARMRPYLKDLMALGGTTMASLGERFTDPFVRSAIANATFDGKMPAMALVMTLAPMSRRTAGYPLGGSLAFARAIEKRFGELGGTIVYGSRVEKILERDGRAIGVRLAGGEEATGDVVIAACDLRGTLFGLLDGSRVDPVHRELLEHGRLYPPIVQAMFGADMDLSGDLSCLGTAYELDRPLELAGRQLSHFVVKNYCFDPTFAPAGKSVVGTMTSADWSYWEPLSASRPAYLAEKERIAALCREEIDHRHPGFASKVEIADVATPHTFSRYTGNWKGTFMTWILSGEFQRKHRFIPKTVPGLSNVYLASMWTDPPGGIPGAASAGRGVVQLLCHADHRPFTAAKP